MSKQIRAFMFFCLLCLILSIIFPVLTKFLSEKASLKYGFNEVNNYAEYFSSVSNWISGVTVPIFTLGSVILLFLTYQTQKEELQNTNDALKKQQFDTTFFNMIELHNSIVENIRIGDNTSRQALSKMWRAFEGKTNSEVSKVYRSQAGEINGTKYDFPEYKINFNDKEKLIAIFDEFYILYEPLLGHYFRNMYRIIKFIEESDLKEVEKNNYRGIFRAQLSSDEIYFLFYNVNFSSKGKEFGDLLQGKSFFEDHIDGLLEGDRTCLKLHRESYNKL
ncbi:hypothetical protein CEY16_05500 [Halalkalibacillus sediminis]|uniref:Phage abortive infection protein n=1 Tax=Halalkalibacillus sediminis TaxID=2018042 RepID=A0A2I0QY07_9BACI|nr:putative phage abortive infection protein [Halalkalibacillus sediminis]PKR79199.1 hypothetical protein CEY16_05500 [Halalkalibacillus sediminis]